MDIRDRRSLKASAAEALGAAPQNRKIVLIWAGASSALSLLVCVLSFLLNSQIEGTGGLAGIGLRSVLSTVQSLVSLASMILVPFWTLGYTAAVLRFSRKQAVSPAVLLEGFRRFGPGLRLMLLRYGIYIALGIASIYLGSIVLSMTPLAEPLYELILQNEELLLSSTPDEALVMPLMEAMAPMLIGCLVLYVIVLIPVTYRLRLAEYCLMDGERCGAMAALRQSNQLMRRRCLPLFRLDLNFWWFYLAHAVVMVLCYGDLLLPALGVVFPFNADTAFFLFYIIGLLAQLALLYFFSNRVETTYARFYGTLTAPTQDNL